jgi:aspartate ammonia-lyase
VDKDCCQSYLEKNPSLATLLAPKIGYLEAQKSPSKPKLKTSVKDVVLERGLLSADELERVFSRKNLLNEP